MSLWHEDLSACSLEEVLRIQADNWEWSKELRRKTAAFVNSRLAHEISHADYQLNRKLIDTETIEYRRRANILDTLIFRLKTGAAPRPAGPAIEETEAKATDEVASTTV